MSEEEYPDEEVEVEVKKVNWMMVLIVGGIALVIALFFIFGFKKSDPVTCPEIPACPVIPPCPACQAIPPCPSCPQQASFTCPTPVVFVNVTMNASLTNYTVYVQNVSNYTYNSSGFSQLTNTSGDYILAWNSSGNYTFKLWNATQCNSSI